MSGDGEKPHRLGRLLGRGAVAEVYEIFDANGARFAGKILHASRENDEAAVARSEHEARLLTGLVHPNIVQVFGRANSVDTDGRIRSCLKLELVDGVDLATEIAISAPMPESRVVELALQITRGLVAAHARGIIHRDLKPANILVAAGEPTVLKIGDFGMARASALSGIDASATAVLGTPDYMAPETLEPLAVEARTDLYALGCMIFEMLTGKVPFAAATPLGILRSHRDAPIPPLPSSVSAGLSDLIVRLMAKSAADRPPSATAVVSQLQALTAGGTQSAANIASASDNACSQCGEPLVPHLQLCLSCGATALTLGHGKYSVIVVGPGEVGDQLDGRRREWLYQVLGKNASLALQANKELSTKIPRLPFVLANGLDERGAKMLAEAMLAATIHATAHEGPIYKHRLMRQKFKQLSGRFMLGASFPILQASHNFTPTWLPFIGFALLSLPAIGAAAHSLTPVTKRGHTANMTLSPTLQAALDSVAERAPLLNTRHRLALRATIRSAFKLRKALGETVQHDDALAELCTRAMAIAADLHRIESGLTTLDLNRADDGVRKQLHERDLLAARWLELDATLERMVLGSTRTPTQSIGAEVLTELRLQIEALEEVQKP